MPNAAAWVPVSLTTRKDGSEGVMPHFIDRAKPGVIAVTRDGKRFANEGNSYHDFVQDMMKAAKPGEEIAAFLVCDHRTLAQIRPRLRGAVSDADRGYLRTGYLKRGATLAELAAQAGIDAEGAGSRPSRSSTSRGAKGATPPSARARAPITAIRATRCTARIPASRRSSTARSMRSSS